MRNEKEWIECVVKHFNETSKDSTHFNNKHFKETCNYVKITDILKYF